MSRIVYVNGRFVPESEAQVSVFDRGFLFGDGVYEVSSVLDGRLVDNAAHLARLERSLGALGMASPATPEEIVRAQKELIARNELDEGIVYLQITRGPADRDFAYPADPKPTLVMFTQEKALVDNPLAARGITVVTVPEVRWKHRDVKTVGLLAASMAAASRLPPDSAQADNLESAASTPSWSRFDLTSASRRICAARTSELSISRASTASFSWGGYSFTPTITSSPRSTRACRRAEDSSMRRMGIPAAMARVMPPNCSTSSISSRAASTMSCVRRSTK